MPTKLDTATPYPPGTKVRATRGLRQVPEGTPGKVKLVNGLSWLRYWVQFDNGVWLGSIDHEALVPADEWDDYQRRRCEAEERQAQAEATPKEATPAEAPEAAPAAASKVPAHLLERSKKARERKGDTGG